MPKLSLRALLGAALALLGPAAAGASPAPRVLLCLGDSLTAGYGLDESQAWPALLQSRLDRELPGWTVVNAGVSGDTSADALRRLDWVLRTRPRAAFVCLGGNDGLRGQSPERLRDHLERIIRRLRARGVWVALGGMDIFPSMGSDYRRRFRAAYREAARAEGVALLPFLLKGVVGRPAEIQADGLHPTAEGQRIIARTVGDFLLPRLRRLKDPRPQSRRAGSAAGPRASDAR